MIDSTSGGQWRWGRAGFALFLAALWLPLFATFAPDGASPDERRELAPQPRFALSAESASALPAASAAWLDDHLGLRGSLIALDTWLRFRVLGLSPFPQRLIVGRAGWLYSDGSLLRPLTRHDAFESDEVDDWVRAFQERSRWLARQGAAYLVVLVPRKSAVYPEYLPQHIEPPPEPNKFARLARELADRSGVAIVYPEAALRAARSRERVYAKTDLHWSAAGAYAGYAEILERLRALLPALAGASPIAVERVALPSRSLDLSRIYGLDAYLKEEIVSVTPREPRARALSEQRQHARRVVLGVDDERLPTAVVFRDSFGIALIPFLSEHFRRVVYPVGSEIARPIVRRERPDLVVQVMWAGRFDSPWRLEQDALRGGWSTGLATARSVGRRAPVE